MRAIKFVAAIGLVFCASSRPVAATPLTPGDASPAANLSIDALVEAGLAELLRPGPVLKDWDKGGIDVDAAVAAAAGGTKANVLLSSDKDRERSVHFVNPKDIRGHVPAEWKFVLGSGDLVAGGPDQELTIGHLEGRFYFAGLGGKRRVGNAFCSAGKVRGELYENPAHTDAGDLPDAMVKVLFDLMVKRLQDKNICWRYDRDGSAYRITYLLEDGRTLPVVNDFDEKVTIVPAAPVAELLSPGL